MGVGRANVNLDAYACICDGQCMTEPDQTTQAAWIAIMRTSRRLLEAVEAALKSAGHPPLAWYDALLEIDKAGNDGVRPFELKARLLLPQYGTSRLLDRMVNWSSVWTARTMAAARSSASLKRDVG